MGFRTLEEIHAYRLSREFKLEVYRIVRAAPLAEQDHRFRSQLFDAAASVEMNIAEGFRRYTAPDFANFLRISRASLEEAVQRVRDGIDRGYFSEAECRTAFALADQAARRITALIRSLRRFTTARR